MVPPGLQQDSKDSFGAGGTTRKSKSMHGGRRKKGGGGGGGDSDGGLPRARTLNKLKTDRDVLVKAVHDKVGTAPNRGVALEYDFEDLLGQTEWREGDSDVDEDAELERMMRGMERVEADAAVDPEAELAKMAFQSEYDYEGVDDDKFLETHYVAPDKFKAMKRVAEEVFLEGRANPATVGTKELSQLGSGMALYFLWLKLLVYWGAFATVMVLPALWAAFSGSRVSEEQMDALFVSAFSVANLGVNQETLNATACAVTDCNTTYVNFGVFETADTTTSLIIAAGDFLYSAAFIWLIVYFRRRIASLDDEIDKNTVTADDFAVYVTNLPIDAAPDELEEHFSDLFQLEKPDWMFEGFCCKQISYKKQRRPGHIMDRGRPDTDANGKRRIRYKSRNYKPVLDTSFDGDKPTYMRSWVCEVQMAYPNGKMIRKFHQRKDMFQELRAARALVKKYDVRSRFADKFEKEKAEKELAKVKKKWDKLAKQPVKIEDEDVVAAFVIFNHEESYIHCLHDYKKSASCLGRCFQAKPLRFRNRTYPITVQKAPDPSNVLWENLETGLASRVCRQLFSLVVTSSLLLISFAVTFQSEQAANALSELVPDPALCAQLFPEMIMGPAFEPGMRLQRNRTADRDGTCKDGQTWVSYPGVHPEVHIVEDVPCIRPCVDMEDETECVASDGETPFQARDIANCFCVSSLTSALSEHGIIDGPQIVLESRDADLCGPFSETYLQGTALSAASTILTIAINGVVAKMMPALTKFERHHTVTDEAASTAIKTFVSQFVNTAIILIVVNARLPGNLGNAVQFAGLFSGDYAGFTVGWYTAVGAPLVHTMIAQVVAPHVAPMLAVFVIGPLQRRLTWKKMTTQYHMNDLFRDPEFNIVESLATTLNILFCVLWFSSGMPLLIPVAWAAFYATYKLQKYLLLRHAPKPPVYDKSLPLLVAELLPYALLGHLLLGIWMYGEPGVTLSDDVQLQNYRIPGVFEPKQMYNSLLKLLKSGGDQLGTAERMVRQNTFPMVMLLLVILVGIVMFRFLGRFWKAFGRRALFVLSCGLWADDPTKLVSLIYNDREWNPPFSEPFEKQLDPDEERVLTPLEVNEGYSITQKDGQNILSRTWPDSGEVDGRPHHRGMPMRTWEVIRAKNLHTYDIMRNDKYKFAIAAMKMTQMQQVREAALKAKGVVATDD